MASRAEAYSVRVSPGRLGRPARLPARSMRRATAMAQVAGRRRRQRITRAVSGGHGQGRAEGDEGQPP